MMFLQITSKQLRDDLMTMLIAGHETTAAVLTWTLHCLADRPDVLDRLQQEVRGNIPAACTPVLCAAYGPADEISACL